MHYMIVVEKKTFLDYFKANNESNTEKGGIYVYIKT